MVEKDAPKESDRSQFQLRIPQGMRSLLKQQAAKNNRTMNAEIVARLELSLDPIGNMVATNDRAQWLFHSRQVQRLGQMGYAVQAMHAYWESNKTQKTLLSSMLEVVLEDAQRAISEAESSTPEALSKAITEIEESSAALKQLIRDQHNALQAAREQIALSNEKKSAD